MIEWIIIGIAAFVLYHLTVLQCVDVDTKLLRKQLKDEFPRLFGWLND